MNHLWRICEHVTNRTDFSWVALFQLHQPTSAEPSQNLAIARGCKGISTSVEVRPYLLKLE